MATIQSAKGNLNVKREAQEHGFPKSIDCPVCDKKMRLHEAMHFVTWREIGISYRCSNKHLHALRKKLREGWSN